MKILTIILISLLVGTIVQAKNKTQTYKITFTSNWNQTDHLATPDNAHFSPIVAVAHNSNYALLNMNGMASAGLEKVAEVGNPDVVNQEIAQEQALGNVDQALNTENQFINRQKVQTFEITVSDKHPNLSFVSMIAPSPDWIVGVSNLKLYSKENGFFMQTSKPISLYAINAGTENGDQAGNFSINNLATVPQQLITPLAGKGFDAPFAIITIAPVN